MPASIRGASACLPVEPGAVRRAGASCGSALAYCRQASRIQPGPKRSEISAQLGDLPRAGGGGGQGKAGAVAHQPQSTTEEEPGHHAALPVPQAHGDGSSSQGANLPSSRFMRRRRCVCVLQGDKPRYPPDSEAGQ